MKQGLTNAEACCRVCINIKTAKRWRYGRRMIVNGRQYVYGCPRQKRSITSPGDILRTRTAAQPSRTTHNSGDAVAGSRC